MKIIRNKSIFNKIIIVSIFLILFNFTFPINSRAEFGGGRLLDPVRDLVLGIGDAFINIGQSIMLPGSPTAVDKTTLLELLARKAWGEDSALTKVTEIGAWIANLPIVGDIVKSQTSTSDAILKAYGFDSLTTSESTKKRVVSMIIYSPAAIFSNLIPALDVNFINPNVWYSGGKGSWSIIVKNGRLDAAYTYDPADEPANDKEKFKDNTAYQLRDTIATWYKALRNIAVVALLSVLVYVAIRIIMSSTAGETAKYKTMLKDWVIAMCILFFIHYMMAFLLKTTEMVTDLFQSDKVVSNLNNKKIKVMGDTFMNESRENAEEIEGDKNDSEDSKSLKKFGYAVIYIILIFYTFIFTWRYLKRFVYLAFLTMISPLVALTYPIDKIKDGRAQAFNYWFREYAFNVLIQPVHLLIYTILITSAQSFAETNLIYTIVAIGFLLEAEKIIKSMFGMNRAEGGIASAGAALTGGAMFGTAVSKLRDGANRLPGGKSKGENGNSSASDRNKVRFTDRNADSGATRGLQSFGGGASSVGVLGSNSGKKGSKLGVTSKLANKKIIAGSKNTAKKISNSASGKTRKGAQLTSGNRKKFPTLTNPRLANAALASNAVPNNLANKKVPRRRIKRTWTGLENVARRYVTLDNGKKLTKMATKGVAMGLGAATLGTIGLAAGIASDNDKDILTYTGVGLGGGALAGGKVVDTGANLTSGAIGTGKNIRDEFQQGYLGEEYKDKKLNPRLDKQWAKDKDVIEHYQSKYGLEYKNKMKEALELRKAGITDQNDIDMAFNLMENHKDLSIDQAANIMQFSKDFTRGDVARNRKTIKKAASNMVKDDKKAEKITKLVEERFKLR